MSKKKNKKPKRLEQYKRPCCWCNKELDLTKVQFYEYSVFCSRRCKEEHMAKLGVTFRPKKQIILRPPKREVKQ